jgi:sugar lactone lactonase YvrE
LEPELIADYQCVIGENPLWHPTEQRVYWIDIPSGRLFRYDPASGQHEQCHAGAVAGGFAIQDDGALLLFLARGAVQRWKDGQLTTIIESIPEEANTRFNDVIADPAGRVYCGTMSDGDRPGRLYRLDPDGRLTRVLDGILCSNGLGFTPDRRTLYYTDSVANVIYAFDYETETGALSNQRVFAHVPPHEGMPDGLTVDAEGGVWSARWGGGCAVRYTPDGREVSRVQLPAERVTSLIFGGTDYSDLYLTTAGGEDRAHLGRGAGALFRVRPGVRGLPEYPSRIQTPRQ